MVTQESGKSVKKNVVVKAVQATSAVLVRDSARRIAAS